MFTRNVCFKVNLGSIFIYPRSIRQENRFLVTNNECNNLQSFYRKHGAVIDKVCSQYPYLKSPEHSSAWANLISTMKEFNFTESDVFQIISQDPQVLTIPHNDLRNIMMRWTQTQLGSDLVIELIRSSPAFLFVPLPVIEKRLPLIQQLTKKPKGVVELLLRCPNVMSEQWEQTAAKLDYLTKVMRVDRAEIFQSSALGKSLEHIMLRHTLLEKCGMYVAPSPYEHKRAKNEKSAFQNAPLKRIVDNEDISFARKICKISQEEFEAYCELFNSRLKAEREEELLSDSDSDSDEE